MSKILNDELSDAALRLVRSGLGTEVNGARFQNAVECFLKSYNDKTAVEVYSCYIGEFIGISEVSRFIKLLSESLDPETLPLKHVKCVYFFVLGLALFETNRDFAECYKRFYNIADEKMELHFLKYWGLCSLFHNVGFPFGQPNLDYVDADSARISMGGEEYLPLMKINEKAKEQLKRLYNLYNSDFDTESILFDFVVRKRLGKLFDFPEYKRLSPTDLKRGYTLTICIDRTLFDSYMVFRELCAVESYRLEEAVPDAIFAVGLHKIIYELYAVREQTPPLKAEDYPFLYLLVLCDKLSETGSADDLKILDLGTFKLPKIKPFKYVVMETKSC